jgi:hypothetical protein
MLKKLILISLFITTLFSIESDILEKTDKFRAPFKSSIFDMKISSYRDKILNDEYLINGQLRIDSDNETKTLIYFKSPKIVEKRKMLIKGNYIWILFPRTKNVIRLSPMQILLGEVSNGDIVRINFSQNYTIEKKEDITTDGKQSYLLSLKIKDELDGSTYKYIDLTIDKESYAPQKALFYSNTHKLIKRAIYSDPILLNNSEPFISKIDIFDAIDESKHSILEYISIEEREIPLNHYSKSFLSRLEAVEIQSNRIK